MTRFCLFALVFLFAVMCTAADNPPVPMGCTISPSTKGNPDFQNFQGKLATMLINWCWENQKNNNIIPQTSGIFFLVPNSSSPTSTSGDAAVVIRIIFHRGDKIEKAKTFWVKEGAEAAFSFFLITYKTVIESLEEKRLPRPKKITRPIAANGLPIVLAQAKPQGKVLEVRIRLKIVYDNLDDPPIEKVERFKRELGAKLARYEQTRLKPTPYVEIQLAPMFFPSGRGDAIILMNWQGHQWINPIPFANFKTFDKAVEAAYQYIVELVDDIERRQNTAGVRAKPLTPPSNFWDGGLFFVVQFSQIPYTLQQVVKSK